MLARLQQTTAVLLALLAVAAFSAIWPLGWLSAIAASLLVLWGYTIWIAVVMVVTAALNRHDPAPNATGRQWLQAWWGESISTWRVFGWRQPFRAKAYADHLPEVGSSPAPRAGVVLIHGFLCNRAFWMPYIKALKAQGTPFIALNLEPVFGSIDDYPPLIEEAVQTLANRSVHPVHLVCHSMGGLAARAWLQRYDGYKRTGQIITIGSPHHGTALSVGTPFENTQQMERFSTWQRQLEASETPEQRARFICWYSHCDNVVVPASTATLEGADNRMVTARGHVDMAFDPRLMQTTLSLLNTPIG